MIQEFAKWFWERAWVLSEFITQAVVCYPTPYRIMSRLSWWTENRWAKWVEICKKNNPKWDSPDNW